MYEIFSIEKLVIRPRDFEIKETGVIADQIPLFQSGGADFAHHITTLPPPLCPLPVLDLSTALIHFA